MWKKGNGNVKNILYITFFLIAVFLLAFIIFYKPKPTYSDKQMDVLGTIVRVRVSGEKVSSSTLLDIAEKEFQRLHNKFSANIEESVVNQLNEKRELIMDEESLFLIKSSINISKMTGDAFDPTLRPVLKLWGFDDVESPKQVPNSEELKKTLELVNYRYIEIEGNKVKLTKPGVKIDLGGIAKGYSVDMVIHRIKELDPKATGFIDAGGDIGIIGPKYGNLPWAIGIRDPFNTTQYTNIDIIYLYDGAIATSGDYERYFIENDKKYHHLIDPKTGYPANDAVSTTVIADDLMNADAFATAAFILGINNPSLDYFTNFGLQVFIIGKDKSTKETQGFDYFREKGR
ncbi:thiamine biosynthesis lipoprotein [Oceanotoga teriensis]|uniref:FAD:protein FMN transferase n=1 Tax=Oceanotoga teriensis TaxID=515440 RepID=A0AA45HIS7_9BACT|nr:FAD:protein FMN transferase [Oceanotoga teriensis]PWJ95240.1 thiamine biosynthesis lipoprotein [Oceanotoga teriensis]